MGRLRIALPLALALVSFGCTGSGTPEAKEPSPSPEPTFPSEEELYRDFGAKTDTEKTIVLTGASLCMFQVGAPMAIAKPAAAKRIVERIKRNRERIARAFASGDLSYYERGLPSRSEMTARDRHLAERSCSYGLSLAIMVAEERIGNDQTSSDE